MKTWMKTALTAALALAAVEHVAAFAPTFSPAALRANSIRSATCAPALRSRVVLKQSEEDALEECLLVMKPCDPSDMDDECLDEEALVACTEASEAVARSELAGMGESEKILNDGSY